MFTNGGRRMVISVNSVGVPVDIHIAQEYGAKGGYETNAYSMDCLSCCIKIFV